MKTPRIYKSRSWYFAYGSNLNVSGMEARCRDAKRGRVAVLDNWSLVFRGVADIEPRPGAKVWGALWRVSKADEKSLDGYEGVPYLYRREYVNVRTSKGTVRALTYIMQKDDICLPSGYYVNSIAQGYRDWSLPDEALAAAVNEAYKRVTVEKGFKEFREDGLKRMRPVEDIPVPGEDEYAGMSPATRMLWELEREEEEAEAFAQYADLADDIIAESTIWDDVDDGVESRQVDEAIDDAKESYGQLKSY